MTIRIIAEPPDVSRAVACGNCRVTLEYHVVDVEQATHVRTGPVDVVATFDPPVSCITCLSCGRAVVVPEWSR